MAYFIDDRIRKRRRESDVAFVIQSTRSIQNNVGKKITHCKSAYLIFHYELTGKSWKCHWSEEKICSCIRSSFYFSYWRSSIQEAKEKKIKFFCKPLIICSHSSVSSEIRWFHEYCAVQCCVCIVICVRLIQSLDKNQFQSLLFVK